MISYYKVNNTKSYILDLGVFSQDRQALQIKILYAWNKSGISYLDITFTPYPEHLFKANYLPLETKFWEGLHHISKHTLSWFGRLATFKMQLLPQLLYVFRLPIPVSKTFFHILQSMLTRFLGYGKKACCSFVQLIKIKNAVGFRLTVFFTYSSVGEKITILNTGWKLVQLYASISLSHFHPKRSASTNSSDTGSVENLSLIKYKLLSYY